MKVGEFVRHDARPEWGIGVVVAWGTDKCTINFEHRAQAILSIASIGNWLEKVAPTQIEEGSALLDPNRWGELVLAPEKRVKPGTKPNITTCQHCAEILNRGQYSSDRRQKSCPRCSVADGAEHVFYACPDGFGRSEERVTEGNPDGDQSYCYACREMEQPSKKTRCSAVQNVG